MGVEGAAWSVAAFKVPSDPDDRQTRPEASVAYPWMTAVDPSLVKGPSGEPGRAPWWSGVSDLAEELLGHLEETEEEYEQHEAE